MADTLNTIVQHMLDAGEPEENIASVIKAYQAKPFDVKAQNAKMQANMAKQPEGTGVGESKLGQGAPTTASYLGGEIAGFAHGLTDIVNPFTYGETGKAAIAGAKQFPDYLKGLSPADAKYLLDYVKQTGEDVLSDPHAVGRILGNVVTGEALKGGPGGGGLPIGGESFGVPTPLATSTAPGAIRAGAARLPGTVRSAGRALSHPAVAVPAGAAIGYATGGPAGALEGAVGGGVTGRVLRSMVKGPELTPLQRAGVGPDLPYQAKPPLTGDERLPVPVSLIEGEAPVITQGATGIPIPGQGLASDLEGSGLSPEKIARMEELRRQRAPQGTIRLAPPSTGPTGSTRDVLMRESGMTPEGTTPITTAAPAGTVRVLPIEPLHQYDIPGVEVPSDLSIEGEQVQPGHAQPPAGQIGSAGVGRSLPEEPTGQIRVLQAEGVDPGRAFPPAGEIGTPQVGQRPPGFVSVDELKNAKGTFSPNDRTLFTETFGVDPEDVSYVTEEMAKTFRDARAGRQFGYRTNAGMDKGASTAASLDVVP